MLWLIEFINNLIRTDFTGRVEINFFKGGIVNINKVESIKPPKSN